ncbi:PAS domain-containing protein [Pelagibius sp. CAU 1746]|uniref:PAS domain-containing protein n=1 Tax=Pelagibius sp. CAU 1746 TaxID=3140370 RepID=UPI00325A824F
MSEISVERVAEAIEHYLSTGRGKAAIAKALDFEVKDLQVRRSPAESDLPMEELRLTLRYWQTLPQVGRVANVMKIEPFELRRALGYLMLIDVGQGAADFRYALYGTKIAKVAGFDMTGKTVWDIATSSTVQTFFAACYMAVRARPCPVYTVHKAPPQITASHWHRLILPLGEGGEVRRFLVCNTPIQHGQLV